MHLEKLFKNRILLPLRNFPRDASPTQLAPSRAMDVNTEEAKYEAQSLDVGVPLRLNSGVGECGGESSSFFHSIRSVL